MQRLPQRVPLSRPRSRSDHPPNAPSAKKHRKPPAPMRPLQPRQSRPATGVLSAKVTGVGDSGLTRNHERMADFERKSAIRVHVTGVGRPSATRQQAPDPFQDGNGRVTRALVTWHLVQHEHLPIVVTRDNRSDYIDALETADDGELDPLVQFTASLHQRAIMQTLSE